MYQLSLVLGLIFATLTSGYQPPKKTTHPCDKDADCLTVPFTFCSENTAYNSGVCSCKKDYVLKQTGNNFECLEEAELFEDPCQIDDQCKPKFGEDAACIKNKCKCRPGAHFINLKCWNSRKLGETCGNSNNCVATEHSQCNGICSCISGYIGNLALTKCLKIAKNIGDPCEDSIQCTSVHADATCQYNVCLCKKGYIQKGNQCLKHVQKLGESCEDTIQCTQLDPSASCVQNKCVCKSGHVSVGNRCLEIPKYLGGSCKNTIQCAQIHPLAICQIDRCLCQPGFITKGNTCLEIPKNMGTKCVDTSQCIFIHPLATCQYNTCFCQPGTTNRGNQCIKIPLRLGDACHYTYNCKQIHPLATCLYDRCICEQGTINQGNMCVQIPVRYNNGNNLQFSILMIISFLVFCTTM